MKLADLTKEERSLLLYLETCAVDHGGLVEKVKMNSDDMEAARRWNVEGFIAFGRVKFDDIYKTYTHWVELPEEAMRLAHEERVARSVRMFEKRTWHKGAEE